MSNSRVPVGQARGVILDWQMQGLTYRDISRKTGLSLGLLHKVAFDKDARIYEATKRKIIEASQTHERSDDE